MEPDWDMLLELLVAWEGFRTYPYDDSTGKTVIKSLCVRKGGQYEVLATGGTVTIGYGETNADFIDQWWTGVPEDVAASRKLWVVKQYWEEGKRLSGVSSARLNPNQAAAWVSLFYNSGPGGPIRYAPALVIASNEGRYEAAASIWRTAIINRGTPVEQGLRNRRAMEADLFLKPWAGSPDDEDDYIVLTE